MDVVDLTFKAMFIIEDIREIWRKTAPLHKLNDEERERVLKLLDSLIDVASKLKELI
ncbi:MAG: hypothetical protein ACTSSJ_04980 [Candidatus Odinarchaeia archaeon]